MPREFTVSNDQVLAFETDCHLFDGCGFPAPSEWSFIFDPLFTIGSFEVDKPMALVVLSTAIICTFFWVAFSRAKVVPGKVQLVAEVLYDFVRRGIARETIGKKAEPYVPLLMSLFFFVWIMNIWAIIPFAQFPATSIIAYPAALALIVWATYMTLTFKTNGFVGGMRNLCVPSGLPKGIYVILTPIEFLSNVIVRPLTLTVRLFANMFAGHLLLLVFIIGTWYTLGSVVGTFYAATSMVMTVALTFFELFIQALQAYVFTALTATYISQALEEAH
ncbi:F0F1 ATP synthase subunit A [Streptomyces sp. MP131-18]|uniref:F0F1 ATP synthase subunit A n=1 Tax=Streptomyces sp. MP131-18 TaxID=1857892 RepID=UPI00097C3C38|nr:F0F1 ATP synthase subunit A [Streptomyces sp. MP131-18]ONK11176.1 F-ATPase subunit 6 [Streptomyces sp. MP131-18]